MAAQPAGEESCRTPLRQVDRGAAVLRPDQATRGRVGRAPGQAREMHWRQAPPAQEGHPGSADSTLSTQAPAQPTSSDFISQRPSYRPPVGAASKKTSRAGLHHARPSVLAASASNPASSWAPVSASLFGQPQATLTYVRVPLHPERAVAHPLASGIEPVRGETAQPVRAEPKSPARRATPNSHGRSWKVRCETSCAKRTSSS